MSSFLPWRRAAAPFALYGGRWNHKGSQVIYTSSSLPLAVLEVIVHKGMVPADCQAIVIRVPDEWAVETVMPSMIPSGLDSPSITATIGSEWANSMRSAVLRVPSVVMRGEYNYLINPLHPEFKHLEFGLLFDVIDERLRLKLDVLNRLRFRQNPSGRLG